MHSGAAHFNTEFVRLKIKKKRNVYGGGDVLVLNSEQLHFHFQF